MHPTSALDAAADQVPLSTVRPRGSYRMYKRDGSLIFLSGQGPMKPDGTFYSGKVGRDVGTLEAYQHARLVGRLMLATLQDAGFALDRVEAIKLLGLVNGDSSFTEHPAVINGCSDYLIETLGERGEHARSAIGAGSLPHNMTVEVEAIFRILE